MPFYALGDVFGPPDLSIQKSQIGRRLDCCLEDADGTLSGHTIRALRADLAGFTAWCAERGLSPLPARAGTVVAYIEAMAPVRASATVRRYVSSIATVHKLAGEPNPLEDASVQRALKRMHRKKGSRQSQVRGLTWPLVRRLLDAAEDRLIDARNRAMLAVAYDAMLRRSELVALQVIDIKRYRDGSASLLVRHAKTDPEGGGAMLYLHRDTVKLVRGMARRDRDRRRAALPLGQEGRRRGRSARREPGAAHLPGDGRARRTPGGDGAADLRAQPAGGGDPGHDRVGDRDPGHHAGRALEEHLDGAALRRAAPRATERRRTARAASETQIAPKTPQGLPRRAPVT